MSEPLGERTRPAGRPLDIGVFGARGIPSTYSGYETFLTTLLPALADRGHDVTMYCRPGEVDGDGPYARRAAGRAAGDARQAAQHAQPRRRGRGAGPSGRATTSCWWSTWPTRRSAG